MSWRPGDLSWMEVHLNSPPAADQLESFFASLVASTRLRPLIFEVSATPQLKLLIGCTRPAHLRPLIFAHLPEASLAQSSRAQPECGTALHARLRTPALGLSGSPDASLPQLISALQQTGATLQLVFGSSFSGTHISTQPHPQPPGLLDQLLGERQATRAELKRRAGRAEQQQVDVCFRLLLPETDRRRVDGAAQRAAAWLRTLAGPSQQTQLRRSSWAAAQRCKRSRTSLRLNATELVLVAGWPVEGVAVPGQTVRARCLPLCTSARSGRHLGCSTHPATLDQPLRLRPQDALQHLHVLGPTGTGKSTLLAGQVLQDIEAGRGGVVIDPKGDLVDDVLARVPNEHVDRLLLVDPSRADFVVSANPLSGSAHVAVDNLISVLRELNRDSWGPRTQDILSGALLTLVLAGEPALALVPRLMHDDSWRRKLTRATELPPSLEAFWSWWDNQSREARFQALAPPMNKLRPLLAHPGISSLISGENRADLLQPGQMTLIPLRRSRLGSFSANLAGALLLQRIWQLVTSRSELPSGQREPLALYLDEFQDYLKLPVPLGDLLAQARGHGVGVVLAHQHLAQLTPDLRAAVLANAQSQLIFRLSASDAAVMAKETDQLSAKDFQLLGGFTAYARTSEKNQRAPFASIRTQQLPRAIRDPEPLAAFLAEVHGEPPSHPPSWTGREEPPDVPLGSLNGGPT